MVQTLMLVATLSFLIKALVDVGKWIAETIGHKDQVGLCVERVSSIVGGIFLCLSFNVDVFPQLGLVPTFPVVTMILTGILIGRGGNVIHDLLARKDVES